MSAVALNSAIWQGTRIVAPAVAGIIIGLIGTATAIFVAGVGFVVMAIVILALRVPRIESGSTGSAIGAPLGGAEIHRRQFDILFPDRDDILQ